RGCGIDRDRGDNEIREKALRGFGQPRADGRPGGAAVVGAEGSSAWRKKATDHRWHWDGPRVEDLRRARADREGAHVVAHVETDARPGVTPVGAAVDTVARAGENRRDRFVDGNEVDTRVEHALPLLALVHTPVHSDTNRIDAERIFALCRQG